MNHSPLTTAAALAIFICIPVVALAQTAGDILDKAEQALGGAAALNDVQAVRIHSHGMWQMQSQGIPPTPYQAESVFSRPDRVRVAWQLPEELGGDFAFGYDGKDAWGVWAAPPARFKGWLREMVLQMAAELQLNFVAPARAAHGDTFELAPADEANPQLANVIYRPFAADKPWSVSFDKDSGDLVKLEHASYHMDGQPAVGRITRSLPKRFGALNYPSHARFDAIRDGKVIETAEETVDSLEINPELPPDFFACPAWEVDVATIDTKDVDAVTIVKCEHRGPYSGISASIDRMMNAVLAAGLIPVAASGTYHDDPAAVAPQDLRTEIAVRVAKKDEKTPELPAGYAFTTQPAMRVAYAYHRGDHAAEGEAHGRLRAWMAEQGLQAAGPPRAIWFHDPEVTVTDDLITEVQIPVRETETPVDAQTTGDSTRPAGDNPVANAGFEQGAVGEAPADWRVPEIPGYRVTTTDERPAAGRQCATIVSTEGSEQSPFGNLLQAVDAGPFRGKRVRLRAAIRAEVTGRGNQAQMWFRVDRPRQNGRPAVGMFDNMSRRSPITSSEWNHYEIVGDVDDDAEYIVIGAFLAGQGNAYVDDVSLEVVGDEVEVTAWRISDGRRGGTALDDIKPGLFEVVSSTRLMPKTNVWGVILGVAQQLSGKETPREVTVLMPLPLAYRDQVPLNFRLTVRPRAAVESLDIYEDHPGNHVLKLVVADVPKWKAVGIRYTSTVLVGPTAFDDVPKAAPLPDAWPKEATPWLTATWCADADHERIRELAGEIRAKTDDVLEIVRRVESVSGSIIRTASGQVRNLTAVEALDKQGSCTSCANLVAALLRACGVPARVLSGYPPWYGPLQTHYIVEAYVPDFGWYPIEATMSRSPWPNTHEIHVAIIPPEYEQESKARMRYDAAGGVPYLSLTEMPGNSGFVAAKGMVDEARSCDHQASMVRALPGVPDEWERAIETARVRWNDWLATQHELDSDGHLQFGKDADEISATSVGELAAELGY